jgi:hypothetical protein
LGLAAALSLAVLAGCSPGPMIDRMPADVGGLPSGVPARPAEPYQYPAVHDMPPDRATAPMSEDEQARVERELQAARDQQEGREGAAKKTGPDTKKRPSAANSGGGDGAKASGAKTNP